VGHLGARATAPDDPIPIGEKSRDGKVEEPGQDLATSEVTGDAKDHDDVIVGPRPN
jgi:hypothetical protein